MRNGLLEAGGGGTTTITYSLRGSFLGMEASGGRMVLINIGATEVKNDIVKLRGLTTKIKYIVRAG